MSRVDASLPVTWAVTNVTYGRMLGLDLQGSEPENFHYTSYVMSSRRGLDHSFH